MASQFVEETYTKGHMMRVMAVDTLIVIIGVVMAASPFVERAFPGNFDTTVHVAVGALIATCALFRVAIAYGSLWLEVVIFALGLIVLSLPRLEHMQWNETYNMVHLAAGGGAMALAAISALITIPVLKKQAAA